jgi:hypothetical protein
VSAILCPLVSDVFTDAETPSKFFDEKERKGMRALAARELPITGAAGALCQTNLFFGFFFDGTKNNYERADKGLNHSNVARLYDCYPGLSVPGVLPKITDWQYEPKNYTHFFKTYIPGVASPFKEVNDSGEHSDETRGAAMGYRGEARIIWALIQAINNVHRYFYKVPIVSASEATKLACQLDLSVAFRRAMRPDAIFDSHNDAARALKRTRDEFEMVLRRLHGAVAPHWPDKKTGRPGKIDPGLVKTIHVSIFGFSRGATQARAFANWLIELCRLDARLTGRGDAMTLGGFKLEVDFLGLFDTVASVGAGNTFGNSWLGKLFDGHATWADAEGNLRIPDGIRCLHLVAAHEIRRSFPLDSIAVGQTVPANSEEVVFPGVHSDLGCGYCPCEQGRGVDRSGADMLARVPLLYMYEAARLAGVPLKLEFASEVARRRFKVVPATIAALNAYLAASATKHGQLSAIMREQARLHMQWRLARRVDSIGAMEKSSSFARATVFDQNDLHSANRELEKEIAAFESWLAKKGHAFTPKPQQPGFDNAHENEWEEIATWWRKAPPPPAAVFAFFDEYVHDSRAWFKLIQGNPDNETAAHELLKGRVATLKTERERNSWLEKEFLANQRASYSLTGRQRANAAKFQPPKSRFSDDEQQLIDEYARTNKIPRMLTEGREPFELGPIAGRAGYLRFRKIYGGSDSVLISDASEVRPDSENSARIRSRA